MTSPQTHQVPESAAPADVISLDAAYAIVSEMRGVYKNALEASSATNRGLKVAVEVGSSRRVWNVVVGVRHFSHHGLMLCLRRFCS